MKNLTVEIPKSCIYNVGVGERKGEDNQRLFGDTNDSSNWDTFSFPLPEGKWRIAKRSEDYRTITLKEDRE